MKSDLTIREPIWKTRSIGIREDRFIGEFLIVKISYKDKSGNDMFPGFFKVYKKDLGRFPVQVVKGNNLKIIPISTMEKINETDKSTLHSN